MRSADGGATWESVATGAEGGALSVACADADHVWIGSKDGCVYGSVDGGDTWQRQLKTSWKIDDVVCVDATHVWALGGMVGSCYASSDGGASWREYNTLGA